ncbi:MAG TPA: hypothetical protein VFQ39_07130 [Longimicrobium sp.]|nr:hypothetical protein [Longimicrobium sp.]
MFVSWILLLFVAAVLVRWAASAWGPGSDRELPAAHTAELARLRQEVDQLTATVVRLQDEQSFMTRLLTDGSGRAGEAGAHPAAPEPETPENP